MNYYVYENTPDFLCGYMEKSGEFNMLCQHYHSTYEILFVLDGVRYIFVNNGTHRMTAGDIAIINPYTLHLTENRESNYYKRYTLNFSDKIFNTIFSDDEIARLLINIQTGVTHIYKNNFYPMERIFYELSCLNEYSDIFSRKKLAAKMTVLLDELGKIIVPKSENSSTDIICSDRIADVLNYINHHFMEDLSLDFIINYSHMSRANFCRVFKKETGNTFLQYLNNLRVAYAHSLLTKTNMSIQNIAEKTGFSSVLHFDRIFKNIHGSAPSIIRKRDKQFVNKKQKTKGKQK